MDTKLASKYSEFKFLENVKKLAKSTYLIERGKLGSVEFGKKLPEILPVELLIEQNSWNEYAEIIADELYSSDIAKSTNLKLYNLLFDSSENNLPNNLITISDFEKIINCYVPLLERELKIVK